MLTVCLGLAAKAYGQVPAWQTAMVVGQVGAGTDPNTNLSAVSAMTAAGNDALYLAGYFRGAVSFGTIPLVTNGEQNVFLAKWSITGNRFMWVQQSGTTGLTSIYEPLKLATQGSNVYLTGGFSSPTLTFGTNVLANSGTNTTDGYVAKLTDYGSTSAFVWAQRFGGTGYESGCALAVSGNRLYIASGTDSPSLTLGAVTLPLTGTNAGIVARLTDTGSAAIVDWVYRPFVGQGSPNDGGASSDLAVEDSTLYVVGHVNGNVTLAGNALTYSYAGFVLKLTDLNNQVAVARVETLAAPSGAMNVSAVAVRGADLYLGGGLVGTGVSFGGTVLANNSPTTQVAVLKAQDTGAGFRTAWARVSSGTGGALVEDLLLNGPDVLASGILFSIRNSSVRGDAVDFDGTTLTNTVSSGSTIPYNDAFVTKLTETGTTARFAWALSVAGFGTEDARALAIANGALYASGWFNTPTVQLGNLTLSSSSPYSTAGYLASISNAGLLGTTGGATKQGEAIWPNPAHGAVQLHLSAGAEASAHVTVLTALGAVVRRYATAPVPGTGQLTLDLNGLAPGLYQVRVQTATQHYQHRLVVE